eukprot:758480-Hanusia_phi.AAC.10
MMYCTVTCNTPIVLLMFTVHCDGLIIMRRRVPLSPGPGRPRRARATPLPVRCLAPVRRLHLLVTMTCPITRRRTVRSTIIGGLRPSSDTKSDDSDDPAVR